MCMNYVFQPRSKMKGLRCQPFSLYSKYLAVLLLVYILHTSQGIILLLT